MKILSFSVRRFLTMFPTNGIKPDIPPGLMDRYLIRENNRSTKIVNFFAA
jgi:hypothetical protein